MQPKLSLDQEQEIYDFLTNMTTWFTYDRNPKFSIVGGTESSIVEIHLTKEAVGGIIGKRGVVINAIKSILDSYGRRIGHQLITQVIEPKDGEPKRIRSHKIEEGDGGE